MCSECGAWGDGHAGMGAKEEWEEWHRIWEWVAWWEHWKRSREDYRLWRVWRVFEFGKEGLNAYRDLDEQDIIIWGVRDDSELPSRPPIQVSSDADGGTRDFVFQVC